VLPDSSLALGVVGGCGGALVRAEDQFDRFSSDRLIQPG
jgi:hypothetical protein